MSDIPVARTDSPEPGEKADMPAYAARPAKPVPAHLSGVADPAKLEAVRAALEAARPKVRTSPDRLELLWAVKDAGMLTGHHAIRLLCKVGDFPFLPQWLEYRCRTRREVLALIDKALRCFAPSHRGGWTVRRAA